MNRQGENITLSSAADQALQSRGWGAPFGGGASTASLPSVSELLALGEASGMPFVLMDNQSDASASLFTEPRNIVIARSGAEVRPALEQLRRGIGAGARYAGYIAYDAGRALLPVAQSDARAPALDMPPAPLLWFADFARVRRGRGDGAAAGAGAADLRPLVERSGYEAMVRSALEHIRAGDIYQINLTFPLGVAIGQGADYYLAARRHARGRFGAFVDTGSRRLLSFSPELLLCTEGDRIEARPMKGTRTRGRTAPADRLRACALVKSAKDRAENLMIVDLLRNDLSKVCVAGSVEVPSLFALEPYPTVWQMTSTVQGRLEARRDVIDAIEALFPCGSVTGAPKIMAMRIADALERHGRGIYTGSIGYLSADFSILNVAIRTIDLVEGQGRLDVGAGIVADSRPRAEWMECLAKARFAGAAR